MTLTSRARQADTVRRRAQRRPCRPRQIPPRPLRPFARSGRTTGAADHRTLHRHTIGCGQAWRVPPPELDRVHDARVVRGQDEAT